MNKELIIEEIKRDISGLEDNQLKEAFDFVRFLKNRNEIDPTIEILENNDFYHSVKTGIKQKKEKKVTDWDQVK